MQRDPYLTVTEPWKEWTSALVTQQQLQALIDVLGLSPGLKSFISYLGEHYDTDTIKVFADYLEEKGLAQHEKLRKQA